MEDLIISTSNLTKKYGKLTAVNGIDLKVEKGEIYGFLGPNGAGKSTTIRMLLGLIKPTKGDAVLFGKSIRESPMEILRRVGSIVESPSYYGNLTACENLEITRQILELDKGEIDRALEIVNLTKWKNKQVRTFSMGMKQRLALAQAILGERELLVLDEPTNGLDPAGIHEIRELIKKLPEIMDVTVLVSSHILSEIELIVTKVGIISNGDMLFQGTLDELKDRSNIEVCVQARPLEPAKKFLAVKGVQAEEREGKLYIKKKKDLNTAVLNRMLVMEGLDVYQISEVQKTLEEIFLDLTGGKSA